MECMSVFGACIGPLLAGIIQDNYGRDKAFTLIMALHAANVLYVLAAVPELHARYCWCRILVSLYTQLCR